MRALRIFALWAATTGALGTMAQSLQKVEYFLDRDPGFGLGKSITNIQTGENLLTFDLSDAGDGAHVLYVRSQDSNGVWSATVSYPIMIKAVPPQSPQNLEYFLDNDPGYGLAKKLSNIHIDNNELTFDLSEAKEGAHVLCVRSQDDTGTWSSVMSRPLFIDRLQDIVYVEYFFDGEDPGIGKATSVVLPDQDYKAHLDFSFTPDISNLELGKHELSVRAKDAFDVWTDVLSDTFTIVKGDEPSVPDIPVTGELARLEYFFDTDPGYGLGKTLENPAMGTNVYQMGVDGIADGAHILYIRAQEKNGQWSSTLAHPFLIYTHAGNMCALEYFFDTDPGYGSGHALTNPTTGTNVYALSLNGIEAGAHILYLRAAEETGNWSAVIAHPLYVVNPSNEPIVAIEYFFDDNDPGMGNATPVQLPADLSEEFAVNVSVDGLTVGNHQFCIRAQDGIGLWSIISSEPFEIISNGVGINQVVWTMPIDIKIGNNVCTLTSKDTGSRGNCHVELYTISGIQIAATEWDATDTAISIPVNAPSGSIILVKVNDTSNGKQIVKRVLNQ